MENHANVQDEDTNRLTHDWREKIDISDKYGKHRGDIIYILSQFEHMWDGHLGRITTAKHRIELLEPTTRSVHSAPYRASSKTREFEKLEIEQKLAELLSSLRRRNEQHQSYLPPRKTGHSDSVSTIVNLTQSPNVTRTQLREWMNVSTH